MTNIMTENMSKMNTHLNATFIEYDARLQVKTDDIKQDIKTAIFLDLQQGQRKIKEELLEDLSYSKINISLTSMPVSISTLQRSTIYAMKSLQNLNRLLLRMSDQHINVNHQYVMTHLKIVTLTE